MRNKKQFFSGFLAALMLLSVGLPVLAEELPEAESKPVCTCSARCNADAPDEDCPVCREDPADCMGTPSDEDGDDADKPVCTCAAACSEDAPNGDCPVCREDPADCMGTPSEGDGDGADKPVCICAAACSEDAPNGDCPVCRENPADCGRAPAVLPDAGSANGLPAAEGADAPEEPEIVVYYHSNWPDAEDETVVSAPVQSDSLYVWLDSPRDVFDSSLDLNTWGFAGWNTQRDGSGRSYASHDKAYIKIYGDGLPIEYHFYAQWDTNSGPMDYRVTLDPNGGGIWDDKQEKYVGEPLEIMLFDAIFGWAPTPDDVSYDGHEFKGWCRDKEGNGKIYLDEDIVLWEETTTLYAQWTPIVSPESVTLHRNLSKEDHYTVAWEKEEMPWPGANLDINISEERAARFLFWTTEPDGGQIVKRWGSIPADLYAQWVEAVDGRAVTYYSDELYRNPNAAYQVFDLSSETALRSPEELGFGREGFLGWSARVRFDPDADPDDGFPDRFTQRDLDQCRDNPSVLGIELTARWATGGHILYDGNGNTEGSVPVDPAFHSIDEDVTLSFPADLKKDGGVLTSWNTAADGSGTGYFPGGRGPWLSEDLRLYAQYAAFVEPDSCRVTYDANGLGGTAPADPTVYRYGEGAVVLSPDGLVQGPGREFLLWNTQPDGQGLDYLPGGTLRVAGDVTLYAIWGRTYTLTYDANAAEYTGELPAPKKYLQGITAPVAGYTLHRDGWLHLGWSTEPDGGIIYGSRYGDDMVPVTEDTTLYAVWVSPLRVRYETGLPEDDPDRARLEKLLPTDEGSYRYADSTDPAYPSAIEVKAPGEPFTRDEYYFDGWKYERKYYWGDPYDVEVLPGETIDMRNDDPDELTLVLRAVWRAESDIRLIPYDANLPEGETLIGELPPDFRAPKNRNFDYYPPDEPIPGCEGYLFAGWDVVEKKDGTTRITMSWVDGLGFVSGSSAYLNRGTDYVIRARWVKPEEMRTMTVRFLDEDGSVHVGTDGKACTVDYSVPEGVRIYAGNLPDFSFGEQNPDWYINYYWPNEEFVDWSFTVDEDMTIIMRAFAPTRGPDFSVDFQAGAFGSLRPADGEPLVRIVSGGAMMSQPLAQTLDIGVPEPVADAGYHFVGWNLEIEYMQGPSRMSAPVETSHAEERLFFLSQVDPAAYVPVWPLDNYYISKLTFTAMFAHDPASDPGGDDPAPNPGGGGGGGGGGGSAPKPPERLLKPLDPKPLEDPEPLKTIVIEENPIPLTGDGSLPGLALLALAVSGCGILLSRRRRP
ncbi:InlB B-repeat-containing protein [Anaerotruncus massiliensis (ex Liu et al. 2021)]|uniref:InlB B-repeat-containing protein n=1 Tax=Anaerotruncus massiliensis (ex Liu et al. 2021) TaxID=2321404 RepID=UPI003AB5428A